MATAKQIAWRKRFAELYGRKKGRGVSMGSRKSAHAHARRQGLVSWATSLISLGIGLTDVFVRASEAMKQESGFKLKWFGETMLADYTGLKLNMGPEDIWGIGGYNWKWDPKQMVRGYAPIAGGVVFKKATTYLVKTAKVQSLIPRLGIGGCSR